MERKQVAIALQGGGHQSAFAWGVIDFFLNDGRLDITGVSTTGLGGLTGAAVIQGLASGGPQKASSMLRDYWTEFYEVSKKMIVLLPNPLDRMIRYYNFSDTLGHMFEKGISPYDRNPLDINPLLDFIKNFFDFELINNEKDKKLFISTTHVKSGKIKIFSNRDISPNVLMASFCLPYIFHAVEIDGDYYWDGGMVANPAINPIINGVPSKDIIVIQLAKNACHEVPTTYSQIENRIREINYSAHLLREMRAIYFISKLIDDGKVIPGALKRINMHIVRNENSNIDAYESSPLSSEWSSITSLYSEGYNCAKRWLAAHYESIGNSHSELSEEVFGAYL